MMETTDATKELYSLEDEHFNDLEARIRDRITEDVDDTCDHITGYYNMPSLQCVQDIVKIVMTTKQQQKE